MGGGGDMLRLGANGKSPYLPLNLTRKLKLDTGRVRDLKNRAIS